MKPSGNCSGSASATSRTNSPATCRSADSASLEVARALAADPVLVVLDEPAAGLRPPEKEALARVLRQIRDEGVTILIVEHDMDFVMGLVDRLVVMEFGCKLVEGDPGRGPRRSEGAGSLSRRRAMSPMLEITDLHVAYGKVEAVRGVSLTLQKGQIVTVIGPNGAGKTTLLAATIGLLPSRGRLIFDGEDLFKLDVEARVEHGFCLVPETRELFGELTVYDNLVLGAYPRRSDRAFVNRALEDAMAVFRVSPNAAAARRHAFGRRTPDAGARPGADVGAAAVDAG